MVSGKVMAADVIGLTSASTLLGKDVAIKVDLGNVYINDAKVIITDIETSNGVIHVVDTVILPPAEVPAIVDTELPVKLPETGAILPDGWAGRGVGLLLLVLGVGGRLCFTQKSLENTFLPENFKQFSKKIG